MTMIVFAALLMVGLIGSFLIRTERDRQAERHLWKFACWLVSALGLVGLCASLLMDSGVLGAGLTPVDRISFLALLTGAPVALAGATYAVLLAYKSIQLTQNEHRRDTTVRVEEVVQRVKANFLQLADLIEKLNIESHAAVRSALVATAERMTSAAGTLPDVTSDESLKAAQRTYSSAFLALSAHLGIMTQCPATLAVINGRLRDQELVAEFALRLGKKSESYDLKSFSSLTEEGSRYFAYADREANESTGLRLHAIMAALAGQAARLQSADLLDMALRTSLNDAAQRLREGEEVIAEGMRPADFFFGPYLDEPVRSKPPESQLHWPARMLLDCPVNQQLTQGLGRGRRVLAVAEVVLADLVRMCPGRTHLKLLLETHLCLAMDKNREGQAVMTKVISRLAFPETTSVGATVGHWADSSLKNMRDAGASMLKHDPQHSLSLIRQALGEGGDAFSQWRSAYRSESMNVLEAMVIEEKDATGGVQRIQRAVGSAKCLALGFQEPLQDELALRWLLLAARMAVGDVSQHRASAVELATRLANQERWPNLAALALRLEFDAGHPHASNEEAFVGVSAADRVKLLEEWFMGAFWGLPSAGVHDQPESPATMVNPEEVCNRTGLLPALLHAFAADAGVRARLVMDSTALCTYRVEAIEMVRANASVVNAFESFVANVPIRRDSARGSEYMDLTTAYEVFCAVAAEQRGSATLIVGA